MTTAEDFNRQIGTFRLALEATVSLMSRNMMRINADSTRMR